MGKSGGNTPGHEGAGEGPVLGVEVLYGGHLHPHLLRHLPPHALLYRLAWGITSHNNNNNLLRKNTIKIFTITWNKIQVHILLIFYKDQAY